MYSNDSFFRVVQASLGIFYKTVDNKQTVKNIVMKISHTKETNENLTTDVGDFKRRQ